MPIVPRRVRQRQARQQFAVRDLLGRERDRHREDAAAHAGAAGRDPERRAAANRDDLRPANRNPVEQELAAARGAPCRDRAGRCSYRGPGNRRCCACPDSRRSQTTPRPSATRATPSSRAETRRRRSISRENAGMCPSFMYCWTRSGSSPSNPMMTSFGRPASTGSRLHAGGRHAQGRDDDAGQLDARGGVLGTGGALGARCWRVLVRVLRRSHECAVPVRCRSAQRLAPSARPCTRCYANSMRFLGVDFGQRRIGLALSDDTALLARPWRTSSPPDRRRQRRRRCSRN